MGTFARWIKLGTLHIVPVTYKLPDADRQLELELYPEAPGQAFLPPSLIIVQREMQLTFSSSSIPYQQLKYSYPFNNSVLDSRMVSGRLWHWAHLHIWFRASTAPFQFGVTEDQMNLPMMIANMRNVFTPPAVVIKVWLSRHCHVLSHSARSRQLWLPRLPPTFLHAKSQYQRWSMVLEYGRHFPLSLKLVPRSRKNWRSRHSVSIALSSLALSNILSRLWLQI